jgi:aspartate/glutamate racemase
MEKWALAWLGRHRISEMGDYSSHFHTIHGDESFAPHYSALQEEIAKLIPRESMRPTIELFVTSSDWREEDGCYGIIGGMGPLSDSQILNEVLQHYSSSNQKKPFRVHLLSIPPPRTLCELIAKGPLYFWRLSSYLQNSFHCIFLASNTAHTNLSLLRSLSKSPIADLTQIVVESIPSDESSTLLLCTLAAHQSQLYETQFLNRQLPHLTPATEQKERIQQLINFTKEGKSLASNEASHDLGLELYELILLLVTSHPTSAQRPTRILLGCTELPIAIRNYVEILERDGFELLDTEKIFAQVISEFILGIRNLS